MEIDFVNYDPNADSKDGVNAMYAMFNEHKIRAEVHVMPNHQSWAGLGPVFTYLEYPRGTDQQYYHKVERYRQGVVFDLVTVGLVARFDIAQFVLRLAVAISLLAAAKTLTETIGYQFVSPGIRKMLQNKAYEPVTETSEFAELGMKAAIAATQFRLFDPDGNGKLDLADIAKVFANVEGVSADKAYAIASVVMQGADSDFNLYQSKLSKLFEACKTKAGKKPLERKTGSLENQGLDFAEFMTCLEGDAIDFNAFLKDVKLPEHVDEKTLKELMDDFKLSDKVNAVVSTASGQPLKPQSAESAGSLAA